MRLAFPNMIFFVPLNESKTVHVMHRVLHALKGTSNA